VACGLGITECDQRSSVDRWAVIFGLILRGLPGLVFATVVGLLLLERRLPLVAGDPEAPIRNHQPG
jgi:hypothetical protein